MGIQGEKEKRKLENKQNKKVDESYKITWQLENKKKGKEGERNRIQLVQFRSGWVQILNKRKRKINEGRVCIEVAKKAENTFGFGRETC